MNERGIFRRGATGRLVSGWLIGINSLTLPAFQNQSAKNNVARRTRRKKGVLTFAYFASFARHFWWTSRTDGNSVGTVKVKPRRAGKEQINFLAMFTIHTPLPNIIGRRCVKLLCQQFWHSGVLATDVNAIIMNLEDGSWHKFFFDSSVLFWKQAQLSPAFDTLITDEFHYPSVDL